MATIKMVNGIPVEMTPQEEAAFEAARTPTLGEAKRAKKEQIADRRRQAENGGFVRLAVRYDSRPNDLSRIAIVAERARTAKVAVEAFTMRVIASDDSESNFNADECIALEKACGDHYLACSANARTLRQAVNAAVDLVGVLQVDIEAGWPA